MSRVASVFGRVERQRSFTFPQHLPVSWQPLQLRNALYWCPDTPQVLALYGCRFPVAALPALAQLPLLETLVADVSDLRCGAEELVASLVLLAVGPPRLVRVRVAGCHGRQYVDVEYIKAEVLRCLALRGRTGVSVHVLGDTHEQGQFDEEADAFGEAEA